LLVIAGLLGGLPAGALVAAPTVVLRPATRARGMGVFYTWYYAGMALLPPVAGSLQDTFGRTAAIHFAATAVFLALPFYLVFVALVRWTASPSRAESTA
jgi:MFS family permease